MLAWRLFLGPILIAGVFALFVLDSRAGLWAPYLWAMACLLTLRSTWELVQLMRVRFDPDLRLLMIAGLLVVSANWTIAVAPPHVFVDARAIRLGPVFLVYALGVLALFVGRMAAYRAPGKTTENLGAELLVLTYVAVFVSLTVQLRWVDPSHPGYLPLGSLIVATKCGDTCAFFAGRSFGKTKLSPLISPGKTRAGAVGAFLGAAAGSWAWFYFATPWLTNASAGPFYVTLLYGLILGVVGLVGDLAESLLKRDLGAKDSAPLLPGFGGLLDLLDSIIFTGPVAYLLWLVLPLVE